MTAELALRLTKEVVQTLMDEAIRGQPMDHRILLAIGVSSKLAAILANEGWLIELSKKVYLLRGDTPSQDGTLVYLSYRIPGLHVGGKTALDWWGVRHNVALHPRLLLWGRKRFSFPQWVKDTIFYSYQTTKLFDDRMDYFAGLKPLPNGDRKVLVSVPERALLELVSDISKGQSLEEVRNLMDFLRNLRPGVLCEFLAYCTRNNVVKLVYQLGKEAGFAWADNLLERVAQVKKDKGLA